MSKIEHLKFDNKALRALPLDKSTQNTPRQVHAACFSRVLPTPVTNPRLVAYSPEALNDLLGLDLNEVKRPDFAEYFSGNKIIPGSEPAAHCYCGHQFGYFSGQLGDGATMYLGEVINPAGERWEIQFKGAGKTPYSRTADGRKVLRSSIREFLCSEANYHLGIPTTRAGCIVTSDTKVIRDIFYSGNPINERCSIVLRIAPTFLRFGSYEIFKATDDMTGRAGPSHGLEENMLPQMLEYTISTFYPELGNISGTTERYIAIFREVVLRTARLVAEWQCFGFCHGVLNTDNMSILGLTIDYGPFGFMDSFDPDYICNGSDNGGRYSYKKQPEICHWNCKKLAEAWESVLPLTESSKVLDLYYPEFEAHYHQKMLKKLGLLRTQQEGDKELIKSFMDVLAKTGGDFTNSFRCLSKFPLPKEKSSTKEEWNLSPDENQVLEYLLSQTTSYETFMKKHKPSIPDDQLRMLTALLQRDPRMLSMMGIDPHQILRELEKREFIQKFGITNQDEKVTQDRAIWVEWLFKYRQRLILESQVTNEDVLSFEKIEEERRSVMNRTNPRFVLRNYIAQNVIKEAEEGRYEPVQKLLDILKHPFDEDEETVSKLDGLDRLPPQWAGELCVT